MWYAIIVFVLGAWVAIDANKRKANPLLWMIGTLVMPPIIVPIYLAKRPLLSGETREGGFGWNVLKNFVFVWTFIMVACVVAGIFSVGQYTTTNPAQSDAEKAGQGLGIMLGMGMMGAIWFFPAFGALTLGFFLKKRDVEKGPEPGAAPDNSKKAGAAYITSWVVLGVFALIVLAGIFSNNTKPQPVSQNAQQPSTTSKVQQQRQEVAVLTLEKFNNLKDGITYKQAVNILGKEGELLSDSSIAGYKTSMYQWSEGFSNMNAMFQNGKLVQKAQFGLK